MPRCTGLLRLLAVLAFAFHFGACGGTVEEPAPAPVIPDEPDTVVTEDADTAEPDDAGEEDTDAGPDEETTDPEETTDDVAEEVADDAETVEDTTDAADAEPPPSPCDEYCDLVTANCTGENTLFEDAVACEEACLLFPNNVDFVAGDGGDSIQCRTYHAGEAASDGTRHNRSSTDGLGVHGPPLDP